MSDQPYRSITGYMEPAFDMGGHYHEAVEYLRRNVDLESFDTFVGIGISGIVMAQRLSLDLDKHLFIIRKSSENSHTGKLAEGRLGSRWVFVDDLIDSGKTLYRAQLTIEILKERYDRIRTEQVGSFLYGQFRGYEWLPEDSSTYLIESWAINEVREELTDELNWNDALMGRKVYS